MIENDIWEIKQESCYIDFVTNIVSSVITKQKFNSDIQNNKPLSEIMLVSTEAFILCSYKNGFERWKWEFENEKHNNSIGGDVDEEEDTDDSDNSQKPMFLYTCKGKLTRNGGWELSGLQYYKRMYHTINKKRNENQEFDEYFTNWYRRNEKKSYKRRKIENPFSRIEIPDDLDVLLKQGGGGGENNILEVENNNQEITPV